MFTLIKWSSGKFPKSDICGFQILPDTEANQIRDLCAAVDLPFLIRAGKAGSAMYKDGGELLGEICFRNLTELEKSIISTLFGNSFGNVDFLQIIEISKTQKLKK